LTTYANKLIDIRISAVVVSLLISLITILFPDTPNDDAYVYIKTAEIFLAEGTLAAFQNYAWASYSILIAFFSQLGFSLFTAAFVINALFYALLVHSFLSIVKLIDDSRQVMLLAALCILLYPQLNEYRYLVIRDVGFWALSLFSLWQLLLYNMNRAIVHATTFSLALMIAATFRAEAIAYLIVVPFAVLFEGSFKKQSRQKDFLRLAGIVLTLLVLAVFLLTLTGTSSSGLVTDFLFRYEPLVNSTFTTSAAESAILGTALFGEHATNFSREYIVLFLAMGFVAVLAANLFNAIGGPFFWLFLYGSFKKYIQAERRLVVPVIFYLAVNAIILFGFLYVMRYLSSRYAMLFCLLVALVIPVVLSRIIDSLRERNWGTIGMRVVILFFGYLGFDSFISFGDSKSFVFDSVDWVNQQSETNVDLITNNHAIAYFTGKVDNYDKTQRFLTEDQIINAQPNDLFAIEMYYEMRLLVTGGQVSNLLEFQTAFPSMKDQRVTIYRRINR